MWNWFQPRCPLGTAEKVWVETRLAWLAERLGSERMIQARVVVPTDEFFPRQFHGTPDEAEAIFQLLLGSMQIDSGSIRLVVRQDWNHESPLGEYEQGEQAAVFLNPSQLEDPESLVGTLAHELAHHILLGGGLVQDNNEDLERLTDLLPAFLGLGIFGANSALREQNLREGRFSWWSMHKQGYLPMRMHAYGLAVFAWVRGETHPAWTRHLRPDIAVPQRAGLCYLMKSSDCLISAGALTLPADVPSIADCQRRLRDALPSSQYAALGYLQEHGPDAAGLKESVAAMLRDRDRDVACQAAQVLGAMGQAAASCAGALHDALVGRSQPLRVQAAYALAAIGTLHPTILNDLLHALEGDDRELAAAAASAISSCAAGSDAIAPRLLPLLQTALVKGDDNLIRQVSVALLSASENADQLVQAHFAGASADLRTFAEDCLAEARHSLAEANEEATEEVVGDEPTPA